MQMMHESGIPSKGGRSAYTFVEVMVAVAVVALMVVTLYLGISTSFSVIQRARENLRATQILVQRVETLRLYTWNQLRNVGATPSFQTRFTDIYDPLAGTSGGGVTYYGNIQVTVPPPVSVLPASISYRGDVALVSVNLQWTNRAGNRVFPHDRQFQTLVAKSGMQKYVYGN
jgi:hypothetical protein